MADTRRIGQHRNATPEGRDSLIRHWAVLAITIITASVTVATIVTFAVNGVWHSGKVQHSVLHRQYYGLPATPGSYIGLYPHGVPGSYAGVKAFTKATGIRPTVVVYYSGWREPFEVGFARIAVNDGAVPLVQMDPDNIDIAAIAAGQYDGYLKTYAEAVRAYRHPVILSFGHEMNGYWYTWGNTHTPPAIFVAAWRHIVTLFRLLGAQNVTWLWTINTIHRDAKVPSPRPWWPGSSYVTWVGIDGYYVDSSSIFASVFGSTIVEVRALTHKPILIAETGATSAIGQPAKITDVFAGIRAYGLLGLVWFDSTNSIHQDFSINGSAAASAFRNGVHDLQWRGLR